MSGKVRVEWAAGERHVVWSDLAGRVILDGELESLRPTWPATGKTKDRPEGRPIRRP
jgi:hypothetical protein